MKTEYPKHQFILNQDEFNALIQVLIENYNVFKKYEGNFASNARHIINTIKRYARYSTEDGEEFVSLNFYDKEARMLIFQFIYFSFATHNAKSEQDFFTQVKMKEMEDLE